MNTNQIKNLAGQTADDIDATRRATMRALRQLRESIDEITDALREGKMAPAGIVTGSFHLNEYANDAEVAATRYNDAMRLGATLVDGETSADLIAALLKASV